VVAVEAEEEVAGSAAPEEGAGAGGIATKDAESTFSFFSLGPSELWPRRFLAAAVNGITFAARAFSSSSRFFLFASTFLGSLGILGIII
jgi:hypothetical protein